MVHVSEWRTFVGRSFFLQETLLYGYVYECMCACFYKNATERYFNFTSAGAAAVAASDRTKAHSGTGFERVGMFFLKKKSSSVYKDGTFFDLFFVSFYLKTICLQKGKIYFTHLTQAHFRGRTSASLKDI